MRDVGTKARWGCYLRTPWFKPYVAGFYAHKYEGREITPQEAVSRMDELLASTPFENVSPDGSIQSAMWKELSL